MTSRLEIFDRLRKAALILFVNMLAATAALAKANESPVQMPSSGPVAFVQGLIGRLWQNIEPILVAIPTIPAEVTGAWSAFGRDPARPLLSGLAMTFLVLVAMALARRLSSSFAQNRLRHDTEKNPAAAVLRRFIVDVVGVLALALVAIIGSELVATGMQLVPSLLRALVDLGLILACALLVPSILFRPGEPDLRLISASESQIARATPYVVLAILAGLAFPTLIPVWLEAGMSWPAAQGLAILIGLFVACAGYLGFRRFLEEQSDTRFWNALAASLSAGFWFCWSYGVISLDFPFYFMMIRLAAVLTTGLILDRLIVHCIKFQRAPAGETPETRIADDENAPIEPVPIASGQFWSDYGQSLRRILCLAIGSAILLVMVGWLAEILPMLLGEGRLATIRDNLGSALLPLCIGFVIFEGLSAWTRVRYASGQVVLKPGGDDDAVVPASRLATVMPIFQGLIGFLVLGISVLMALSRIGVDITPILAGAGILGLAISFGSQSLVRDVVAGIFYMIDDAFRLSEYIEAGRLKGSVERISVRSVQLRHHNGYLHTVPFGQLGSITNYSRDWVTLKFNLRLARNTDIEMVRKTVKKIGIEMLEDPEYGSEFILPLKMQGIADIVENALVARFKFTVKPGKPTYIQREAIKRIIRVFSAQGIEFAQHSVIIQGLHDAAEPEDLVRAASGFLPSPAPRADRPD
ncbi:Mechanosensitive ion channel MscS [Rhabdaerophilaceae bacterium]